MNAVRRQKGSNFGMLGLEGAVSLDIDYNASRWELFFLLAEACIGRAQNPKEPFFR